MGTASAGKAPTSDLCLGVAMWSVSLGHSSYGGCRLLALETVTSSVAPLWPPPLGWLSCLPTYCKTWLYSSLLFRCVSGRTTIQPNPALQALGDTSQVRNKLMPLCLPLLGRCPPHGHPFAPVILKLPRRGRQAGSNAAQHPPPLPASLLMSSTSSHRTGEASPSCPPSKPQKYLWSFSEH